MEGSTTQQPQSTLSTLLSLLTTSIHAIESELKASNMPPFTLDAQWHPLDSLDAMPTPRLYEARRVAMGSANMIKALVQDIGTAMMNMSLRTLEQAAYKLTADIRLLEVFQTDEEKTRGLHIDEIVARLPDGRKVDPHKLARCLRLLSTEHWWIEPSPNVFAPQRWALLNTPDSASWAWADSNSHGALMGSIAFTAQMTDRGQMHSGAVAATPFIRGIHATGRTEVEDYWDWLVREPERLAKFAQSMEGCGFLDIAALKADYPWEALPPNTTFVDVGAGQGTISMHILRLVYEKVPTLKVVLQDRPAHLEEAKKYWVQMLPAALEDGRVEFEVHDFFKENPRKTQNTVYWLRFILHDWSDEFALQILKGIRATCHPTSKVLVCDCILREALPAKLDVEAPSTFKKNIAAVKNDAPYDPIEVPYPLPQNCAFASKATHQFDILMYTLVNGLERTYGNLEKIVSASGFKIDRVYPTRGMTSIVELVPWNVSE